MLHHFSLWEGNLLLWIQDVIRTPILTPFICLYTKLGNFGLLWMGICVLLLIKPSTRRAGLAGGAALGFSILLTNLVLKNLVDRPRPWLVLDGLIPLVREHSPQSFPSGHTSAAFAAAIAWHGTLSEPGIKGMGISGAVLMGLSRLYVGVHFPTDVLFGMLSGILCGILGMMASKALYSRANLKKNDPGNSEKGNRLK